MSSIEAEQSSQTHTHAVLARINVDIDLCYSVKCCPAKTVLFTPQIQQQNGDCDKVSSVISFTQCCRRDLWTLRRWIQIDPQS